MTSADATPPDPLNERGLPRPLEVSMAALLLLACSPLLLLAGILIRLTSPGPAVFRQQRVGRAGVPFELLKLRTMVTDAVNDALPSRARLSPQCSVVSAGCQRPAEITADGDPRITPVGKWLRRTKLDELPELWNVIRGDMSLVGPRPEVPRYVVREDPLWQRALEVRPGLTDPASLALRSEERVLALLARAVEPTEPTDLYTRYLLPYKLKRSTEYGTARTAWSDLGVLWRTLLAVALPTRNEQVLAEQILAESAPPGGSPGSVSLPHDNRSHQPSASSRASQPESSE